MLPALVLALVLATPAPAPPVQLFATQPGALARDDWFGGEGSPFGSAFAEVLGRDASSLETLLQVVAERTRERSGRDQRVAFPKVAPDWQIAPAQPGERRVALVLVVSQYQHHRLLLGARHDGHAVAAALEALGFATTRLIDPDPGSLDGALERFAVASAQADAAVVFVSGHGVAAGGIDHLLLPQAPRHPSRDALARVAVPLPRLVGMARARKISLVVFGGCRREIRER